MGQFALPLLIATTAVSGGVAAKAQIDAGKAAKAEAKAQSAREGDAARAREIERRRQLLRALASQSAEAGAFGASPDLSVLSGDIKYAQDDLLTDRANTSAEQQALYARGKNARRAGKFGAYGSILDAGKDIATVLK